MLGYTQEDVIDMMAGINDGIFYLPPSAEKQKKQLNMAFDFLEGLLAEGRV
jgi:hypothetical protein